MKLFDAHCHLQDDRLAADLDNNLLSAQTAGVTKLACCGTSEKDWPRVLELSQKHDYIVPSFGLHPWFIAERTDSWEERLVEYLNTVPSGVGEVGLDHALENRDDKLQESVFLAQTAIAAELNRPVAIHCRRAWGRLPQLLKEATCLPERFVIHSYSGGVDLIKPLTKLGAYFSFSGSITFTNNKRGANALAAVPEERLLIETDAPDISPVLPDGTRPEINKPEYLPLVLKRVAEIRNTPEEELAEILWDNSSRFYNLGS